VASINKLSSGRWRARYRDPQGRSRSKTFDRKRDAERFISASSTDMERGRWTDPQRGRVTVGAWADEYLATVVNLRASTRYTYERDLGKYVLPRFARVQLAQVRGVDVQAWLAEELASGLSPSSVHRHYRTLRRLLEVAVQAQLIPLNPCGRVTPPSIPSVEMRFLTAAEVGDLAEAIGLWYRAFIYTAAYAGLRWSELVGLRAKRVDLLRRTVTVTEQLLLLDNGQRQVWEQPKTKAGVRSIGIPAFLADMLQEQLDERALPGADGLIFPNRAGKPTASASFNTHHFSPAKRRAGIDGRLRFHDLRHTAVALAIAQGAHPKAIQARMGHSSVQMTLDRYGHLFPELDERVAQGLDETYRSALESRTEATAPADLTRRRQVP
jgi:integrase